MEIRNVGPIDNCKIDFNSFSVITGKQSSGKSTVAKSLYFFLSLKDRLVQLVFKFKNPGMKKEYRSESLNRLFKQDVLSMLQQIFGVKDSYIHQGSYLRMNYSDDIYVQTAYNETFTISYSNKLRDFIKKLENENVENFDHNYFGKLQEEINDFFDMDYSPVYIPAGRSIMTIIGSQFELFYATLNDDNRNLIDLCTRTFFTTVMQLKPLFGKGLSKLWKNQRINDITEKAKEYMKSVINGEYYYTNNGEYLKLTDGKNIKVNMISSGQQEALWIYNILIYCAKASLKRFYIIEEPESNLFPESQQKISKFLGLISNMGNPMLITTHSPYILGEINNMIYAGTISGSGKKRKTYDIIDKDCQLKYDSLRAFFIEDGIVNDCMDYDIKQIDSLKLDSISDVINKEYDLLLQIDRSK